MSGFNADISASEFEQLIAFERHGTTAPGDTLSHALARRLHERGYAARIPKMGWAVTKKGQEVLDAWRTVCRNLRVPEIR